MGWRTGEQGAWSWTLCCFTWWSAGKRVRWDEDSGHFPLQSRFSVFPTSQCPQFPIKREKVELLQKYVPPSTDLSRLVTPGVRTCVDLEPGTKWVLVLLSYSNSHPVKRGFNIELSNVYVKYAVVGVASLDASLKDNSISFAISQILSWPKFNIFSSLSSRSVTVTIFSALSFCKSDLDQNIIF